MISPLVYCPRHGGQPTRGGSCAVCAANTIRLPYTKPPLNLNDRMHWRKKAAVVKAVRAYVGGMAIYMKPFQTVRVELHYVPRDKRRRDADNLVATLKPCLDGLVDAGVIRDDSPEYVTWTVHIDPPSPDPHLYLLVEAA